MILMLMCLAAAFQWSCDKDTVTPSNEGIEFRNRPPHDHGDGDGDGDEVVYELVHSGILTNGPASGIEITNNKKQERISTSGCSGPFALNGVSGLPLDPPCSLTPFCITGHEIYLNKKNNPDSIVIAKFNYEDAACGGQTRLWMRGYIDKGSTIFPTKGNPVNMTFTEWYIVGCGDCVSGASGDYIPLGAAQTLTITWVEGPCTGAGSCN